VILIPFRLTYYRIQFVSEINVRRTWYIPFSQNASLVSPHCCFPTPNHPQSPPIRCSYKCCVVYNSISFDVEVSTQTNAVVLFEADSETMDEVKRQDVIRAVSILDCIKAVAYETVIEAAQTYGTSDREISDHTETIISFFTTTFVPSISSSPSLFSRTISGSPRRRLRRHQSLVTLKTDTVDGNTAISSYEMVCDDLSSRDAAGVGGGISSFSRHGLGLGRLIETPSIRGGGLDQLSHNNSGAGEQEVVKDGAAELNNDNGQRTGYMESSGRVEACYHSVDAVAPLRDHDGQRRHIEDNNDNDPGDCGENNRNRSTPTDIDQLFEPKDSSPKVAHQSPSDTWSQQATAPSTVRRHTSLKAAVRSLLPAVSTRTRIRRQQSELRHSSSRVESRSSTSNSQPGAAFAATLDVQFRRSNSAQSADIDDVINRLSVHPGPDDLHIYDPARSTVISTTTLSSRIPDVTSVEHPPEGTFDSRLERAPDLIQRLSQTLILDEKNKLPPQDGVHRSPTMTSHQTGRSTLRRIVSFGSRSVWSKTDNK